MNRDAKMAIRVAAGVSFLFTGLLALLFKTSFFASTIIFFIVFVIMFFCMLLLTMASKSDKKCDYPDEVISLDPSE